MKGDTETMRIGLLGAGGIAGTMAQTVAKMNGVQNYAVASRSLEKAQAFAARFGVEKAYGTYEEMLADDRVDLVYVATPHSHHYEWTLAALNAGKNVLCEKAFAANARQAEEMLETAEKKHLLLTEAIWTRYMPSRNKIREIIDAGEIGPVRTVSANLGYQISGVERMIRPELAGGCLLDLTVYPLNFASMILGDGYERITASAVMTDTGVDGQDGVTIIYPEGKMATLFTTMYSQTDRRGLIYGERGHLVVENINNPEKLSVFTNDGGRLTLRSEWTPPAQISGYEYEVEACRKALEEGRIECPEMPHAETLEIMRQMDEIRRQFGIVFPFEQ